MKDTNDFLFPSFIFSFCLYIFFEYFDEENKIRLLSLVGSKFLLACKNFYVLQRGKDFLFF
jgi:hypothetical protein